jgi:glycyl-tRNA synthetase beta chain
VAFFAVGEKPTGSRDPFALRRAAQGIIRIVLENGLRVPLARVCRHLRNSLGDAIERDDVANVAAAEELLQFIADRLKVHLREQGVRHDLIAAAFETLGITGIGVAHRYEDDLVRLMARVRALQGFLATDDGANLLTAYRRAVNIVRIEERRDDDSYSGPVDPNLLPEPRERRLYDALNGMDSTLQSFFAQEQFDRVMERLATLRRPVDEFFDKVTVNVDDRALRENRLRLLSRIRAVMNQVADFSQIEG